MPAVFIVHVSRPNSPISPNSRDATCRHISHTFPGSPDYTFHVCRIAMLPTAASPFPILSSSCRVSSTRALVFVWYRTVVPTAPCCAVLYRVVRPDRSIPFHGVPFIGNNHRPAPRSVLRPHPFSSLLPVFTIFLRTLANNVLVLHLPHEHHLPPQHTANTFIRPVPILLSLFSRLFFCSPISDWWAKEEFPA